MDDISPFTRFGPDDEITDASQLQQRLMQAEAQRLQQLQRLPQKARQLERSTRGSGVTVQPYRPRESAIIRQAQIDRARPWFERGLALCLLLISFASTMILFNGGWHAPFDQSRIILAVVVQLYCTITQWLYRKQWRASVWFVSSILIDVATSAGGIYSVAHDSLLSIIPIGGTIVVWLIVISISIVIAIVPEAILID